MKIRTKFLVIMLLLAVIPAIMVSLIINFYLGRMQEKVAQGAYAVLGDDARESLRTVVENFGMQFNSQMVALRLTLDNQAMAVMERLAGPVPEKHPEIIFAGQPVNDNQQVFYIAPGVDVNSAVKDDMARLANMSGIYAELRNINSKIITSQYTALENGVYCSFPGKGKTFPVGFVPRQRPWFREAIKKPSLSWHLMNDMLTCNYILTVVSPLHDKGGKFVGVTCVDADMTDLLNMLQLPESWSNSAQIMFLQVIKTAAGEETFTIFLRNCRQTNSFYQNPQPLDELQKEAPLAVSQIKNFLRNDVSGVVEMLYQGHESICAFGRQNQNGIVPMVIIPKKIVTSDAEDSLQLVRKTGTRIIEYSMLGMFPVLLLAGILAWLISRRITSPIHQLVDASRKLAHGDFSVRVDIKTRDEIRQLGEVFNQMGPQLKDREQIKHSLFLASEVQHNLLPSESPDVKGFDIFGRSDYCDETGGDYFDFIPLDNGQLAIAVGDITGHGVGAALLMATARALIRSHAFHHDCTLGKMIEDVNVHLVHDTGDSRFMTLFFGVLDPEHREMRWVSCGHDPALLLRSGSGQIEELNNDGLLLGVVEKARYSESGPVKLEEDDVMVIGTDGIWEAHSESGEMFGRDRLRQIMRETQNLQAREIHHAIVRAVRDFCGSKSPEDDITLAVIKVKKSTQN